MKKVLFTTFVAAVLVTAPTFGATINMYGNQRGPNDTSSDFESWGINGVDGLQADGTATGDPTNEPEYWNPITSANTRQFTLLDGSWKANASPSDPDEQNENGTGIYTGIAITSDSDFFAGDLEYGITANNISGRYGNPVDGDLSGLAFSPWAIGIDADDTVYKDGESMDDTPIREFYWTGIGLGFEPESSWTGSNQSLLDQLVLDFNSNLGVDPTYTWDYQLFDSSGVIKLGGGEQTLDVVSAHPVPTPSGLAMGIVGLGYLFLRRHPRQRAC